jgi:rhamnosyltransferase
MPSKKNERQTCAVVVAFHPNINKLLQNIEAILAECNHLVLFDNSSLPELFSKTKDLVNVHYHSCNTNVGVACAQNYGINYAMQHHFDYVILFDQDSSPSNNMISTLLTTITELNQKSEIVCSVGPYFYNTVTQSYTKFIRYQNGLMKRLSPISDNDKTPIEADYIISSGQVIKLSSIPKIGYMNEQLFIDYIDIDWGLRAIQNGYRIYGVPSATMQHDLGDRLIKFMGKSYLCRTPLRHYYMIRNCIYLSFYSKLPIAWKLRETYGSLLKFFAYCLLTKQKIENLRFMTKGIYHGLTKRLGPH